MWVDGYGCEGGCVMVGGCLCVSVFVSENGTVYNGCGNVVHCALVWPAPHAKFSSNLRGTVHYDYI